MKAIVNSKIIFPLILMGLLSCKKNDGYSDEIDTANTSSVNVTSDSLNSNKINGVTPAGSRTPADTNGTNSNESSAGTVNGPGGSVNDASTYTISSGVQKDSTNSKTKGSQNKSK